MTAREADERTLAILVYWWPFSLKECPPLALQYLYHLSLPVSLDWVGREKYFSAKTLVAWFRVFTMITSTYGGDENYQHWRSFHMLGWISGVTMTLSSLLEEHGEHQVFWFFKLLNIFEFLIIKDIYICIKFLILLMFKMQILDQSALMGILRCMYNRWQERIRVLSGYLRGSWPG